MAKTTKLSGTTDHRQPSPPEVERTPTSTSGDAMEAPSGTVAEVLAWVSDDPERARVALEAEEASEAPRSTLVAELEKRA